MAGIESDIFNIKTRYCAAISLFAKTWPSGDECPDTVPSTQKAPGTAGNVNYYFYDFKPKTLYTFTALASPYSPLTTPDDGLTMLDDAQAVTRLVLKPKLLGRTEKLRQCVCVLGGANPREPKIRDAVIFAAAVTALRPDLEVAYDDTSVKLEVSCVKTMAAP